MAFEGPTQSFIAIMAGLKAKDEEANRKLYERYIKSVIRLASTRLDPRLRARVDPECVAHSAIMELFEGVLSDRVQFQGWAALFGFLATVTKRKALNQNRYHNQAKRNGAKVGAVSDRPPEVSFEEHLLAHPEAGPAEMAEIHDLMEVALGQLDEQTRKTVESFLRNASKMETSKEMGVSIRTVERRIEDFRDVYDRVAGNESE